MAKRTVKTTPAAREGEYPYAGGLVGSKGEHEGGSYWESDIFEGGDDLI